MTAPAGGPPCDLCQQEPAVMSQMNLADYGTIYVGVACLTTFYGAMLAQITGPPEGKSADTPSPASAGEPAGTAEPAPGDAPAAGNGAAESPSAPRAGGRKRAGTTRP